MGPASWFTAPPRPQPLAHALGRALPAKTGWQSLAARHFREALRFRPAEVEKGAGPRRVLESAKHLSFRFDGERPSNEGRVLKQEEMGASQHLIPFLCVTRTFCNFFIIIIIFFEG